MQENEVISFGVYGYSRGHQELSVRANGDGTYTAFIMKKYAPDDVDNFEVALDQADVDRFLAEAEKIGVFEWQPRYLKSPFDGTDWSLEIDCEAHPALKSRGVTDQPANFRDFLNLLPILGL